MVSSTVSLTRPIPFFWRTLLFSEHSICGDVAITSNPPRGLTFLEPRILGTVETWDIQKVLESDRVLRVAYRSISQEWIVHPGAECLIAPPFDPAEGIGSAQAVFGAAEVEERWPNPENPGGHVTAVNRRGGEHQWSAERCKNWMAGGRPRNSSTGESQRSGAE
jgi:hypothetical protein